MRESALWSLPPEILQQTINKTRMFNLAPPNKTQEARLFSLLRGGRQPSTGRRLVETSAYNGIRKTITSAQFMAVYLTLFLRFQLRAEKTQQKPEIRLIDTRIYLVRENERRKQPPNPTSPSIAHKSAHFSYRYATAAAAQSRRSRGFNCTVIKSGRDQEKSLSYSLA